VSDTGTRSCTARIGNLVPAAAATACVVHKQTSGDAGIRRVEAEGGPGSPGSGDRIPTGDRADRAPALSEVDTAFNVGRPRVRAGVVDQGNDGREAIAAREGEAQLV